MKEQKVYEAILKAASHIEGHPEDFNFMAIRMPTACGTPGCALGWIGFYMDPAFKIFRWYAYPLRKLGFGDPSEFYNALATTKAARYPAPSWHYDAGVCARALREFAQRYREEPDAFKPWLAELMTKVEGLPIPESANV